MYQYCYKKSINVLVLFCSWKNKEKKIYSQVSVKIVIVKLLCFGSTLEKKTKIL